MINHFQLGIALEFPFDFVLSGYSGHTFSIRLDFWLDHHFRYKMRICCWNTTIRSIDCDHDLSKNTSFPICLTSSSFSSFLCLRLLPLRPLRPCRSIVLGVLHFTWIKRQNSKKTLSHWPHLFRFFFKLISIVHNVLFASLDRIVASQSTRAERHDRSSHFTIWFTIISTLANLLFFLCWSLSYDDGFTQPFTHL